MDRDFWVETVPNKTTLQAETVNRVAELEGKLEAISRSHMVVEFDLQGSVLCANQNFLDTFGYDARETIGRNHAMFVDAETLDSPHYRDFWARLVQGEYTAQEYKRIGKGGREIWVQASYNPIFGTDGTVTKVIKYATDVTEARLKSTDVSGQITAIGKSQAVVEFDLNGMILSANPNFLKIMGYDLKELHGRHHSILVEPDVVRQKNYEEFWANLRTGAYHAGEYRRVTRSGDFVWLQASYNPILDLNGRPFKIVKYASDLTEVIERRAAAASLEAARNAAEINAAAKSDFLANMSHELRTPLTGIIGFSNLIGTTSTLSETDQRYLGLIRNAGQTLLTVVNDILDFSKLEAGAMALSPESVAIEGLVDEVVSLMQDRAQAKGLKLGFTVSSDTFVQIDRNRLSQVLLNLIGNAVKFTQTGQVSVSVEASALQNEEVMLDIRITDTGPGIECDQIDRLFQRFTQADDSTTRNYGGTGLGLAISQQIVTLMGGTIGVESDGHSGSTFWVRLPCPAARAPIATDHQAPPAIAPSRNLRVLVAEDHPANQVLIAALLDSFCVRFDIVETGALAVDAVRTADYDLVLMDMQMPVMDGLEATRTIRSLDKPACDVPIVALTANILPEQIERCLHAGMQTTLAKPIDPAALCAVLQTRDNRPGLAMVA